MTRRTIMFLLVVTGIGTSAVLSWRMLAANGQSHNAIQVIPEKLVIPEQEKLSVTSELTIRNSGDTDIELNDVHTTCGCTLPEPLSVAVLHPGEETRLKLKLVPPGIGVKQTVLTISTNSALQPQIVVPIEMHGRPWQAPAIAQQPIEVRETIAEGEEFRTTVAIQTHEQVGEPWLLGLDCDSTDILIAKPEEVHSIQASEAIVVRDYSIEIRGTPAVDSPSQIIAWLMPRTATKPTRAIAPIRLMIERQAILRAYPSQLLVSHKNSEKWPIQRTIAIVASHDEDWEIREASSAAAWLSAETLTKDGEEPRVRFLKIDIREPPDELGTTMEQVLNVKTSCSKQPAIDIPIIVER